MKKFLLLVAAVVACALGMAAQQTLTVHDGDATNGYAPIHGYWCDNYLKCEFVMPADELAAMNGKEIQQLTWYLNEAPTGNGWGDGIFQIFMKEVDATTLSAFTGTEGATVVYEGTLDPLGKEELAIEFTTPYSYGGGNLLIGVYHISKGRYMTTVFKGENVEGACVQGYSGSALDEVSANQRNFIPKTTFTYGEKAPYAAAVMPTALNFGKVHPSESKVLNVKVKNNGLNAFTPAVSVDGPFSAGETSEIASGAELEIPVTCAPTALGVYSLILTVDCGEAGSFIVELTGICSDDNELTICDGTNENVYLPMYGFYYDTPNTLSQMIYPADMLADIKDCQITGVKFYPNGTMGLTEGQLEVSLGETENTEYANGDEGIEGVVTNLTTMLTTPLTSGATTLEFNFDNPYTYNGGNLALQTLVAEAGNWKTQYFYGTNVDYNAGFYQYTSSWSTTPSTGLVKFLPKMTIVYKKAAEEPEATYYVAGFNDWENQIEITADGAVVEASAQNFDDPQDTAQEFKIVTTDANGEPVYYGGIDENQAGYFWIDNTLLGQPITLNDEGSNFRLPEPGNYTIKIVKDETKNPVEGIQMVVTKNTVTAIETINSDVKGDNYYYNLMGQKMNGNNLPAGIYIHNGKKIIVR